MILEEINKANVVAFKEKNAVIKDVISVIKSRAKLLEVEKRASMQEITDGDVANLIQKLIKELAEAQENYNKVGNTAEVDNLAKQIEFCKKYLPKKLDVNEIKAVIMTLDDKSVPNVMKYFKINYAGAVDMREVQEVLKTMNN